jgi:hypothetical protein
MKKMKIKSRICALTLALSFGLSGCDETEIPPSYISEIYSTPKLEGDSCSKIIFIQESWWFYSKHFDGTHVSNETGKKMCDYK